MGLFRNKLVFFLTAALAVCLLSYWYFSEPVDKLDQEKLITWIKSGYSTQFCNVVFPRIQNCISIKQNACTDLVLKSLGQCLNALPKDPVNLDDAKKIYSGIAPCFENKIHNEIVSNYLLDSAECRKKLS